MEDEASDVKDAVEKTLGQLAEKATTPIVLNALFQALGNEEFEIRFAATKVLGQLSEKAASPAVFDVLFEMMESEEDGIRHDAIEILVQLSIQAAAIPTVFDKLLTALALVLEDGTVLVHVVESTVEALGQLGEKAATPAVVNALTKTLEYKRSTIKCAAAKALGQLGAKAATPAAVDALSKALEDKDKHLSCAAAKALGQLGEKAATPTIVDALSKVLEDKEGYEYGRKAAAAALGQLGAKAATPVVFGSLSKALEDKDEYVRHAAIETFSQLGEKVATPLVFGVLFKILEGGGWHEKESVVEALKRLSEKAPTSAILDILLKALEDREFNVKRGAAKTLSHLGEKVATPTVFAALFKALEGGNWYEKSQVVEDLKHLCEKAPTPATLDILFKALEDKEFNVKRAAEIVLGQLAAMPTIFDTLCKALEHEKFGIRSGAAEALCRLDEKAATKAPTPAVLSALSKALEDTEKSIRSTAVMTLGRLGEKAATPAVLTTLAKVLETEEDWYTKRLTIDALCQLSQKEIRPEMLLPLFKALAASDFENTDLLLQKLSSFSAMEAWAQLLQMQPNCLKDLFMYTTATGLLLRRQGGKIILSNGRQQEILLPLDTLRLQDYYKAFLEQAKILGLPTHVYEAYLAGKEPFPVTMGEVADEKQSVSPELTEIRALAEQGKQHTAQLTHAVAQLADINFNIVMGGLSLPSLENNMPPAVEESKTDAIAAPSSSEAPLPQPTPSTASRDTSSPATTFSPALAAHIPDNKRSANSQEIPAMAAEATPIDNLRVTEVVSGPASTPSHRY